MLRDRPPSFTAALPAYLGGKRRLLRPIFGLLQTALPRSEWSRSRLIDPMCGGGAVALYAKALGFSVTSSDASAIGCTVARALIANSNVRLQREHLLGLFSPGDELPGPSHAFVPDVFTSRQAAWIDDALVATQNRTGPVRALLELVIIRTALRLQPMSMLDATDARHLATGALDEISSRRLRHYLHADRALEFPALERLSNQINRGVFGGSGEACRGDAREVLATSYADVVYLDPPYPGTTGYRDPYRPLRTLLGDALDEEPPTLEELLEASAHIPVAVISYGGAGVELADVTNLVARHRRVLRAVEVPYPHLKSLARKEAARANRELIIVATR